VGDLEESPLVGQRPGEGAFHVTEQLTLEQALGEGAAVDRHEWAIGARAGGMDRSRDQLLARPGLALDEHRAPGRGDPGGDRVNFPHPFGDAHDGIDLALVANGFGGGSDG
jgi:hypothetical protein